MHATVNRQYIGGSHVICGTEGQIRGRTSDPWILAGYSRIPTHRCLPCEVYCITEISNVYSMQSPSMVGNRSASNLTRKIIRPTH
jgi:hypothetical protein